MSKKKNGAGSGLDAGSAGDRVNFSGSLGYILAVAGSAVGLGNIWRFPYLAAKYGGGIFLLVYLVLMVTFGSALIISETALGRMTGKSPVGAFTSFSNGTKRRDMPLRTAGWINAIIPMLIAPYYCVIGGWVTKFFVEYLTGASDELTDSSYFTGFLGDSASGVLWFVVFALAVTVVIMLGVENGIEKISKFMMPVLVVLAIFIAIYSMTRPGAMAGVKYFLVPDFHNFSIMTVVVAMGQMFYSLSIAMGILYTYGSYLKKDVNIETSTIQIEIFDTGIAILAGLMIIPAVFAFSGGDPDALQAGPSLMFITMPKIFGSMAFGKVVGLVFFIMVLFAALTSAISLMETGVSTFMDQTGWNRIKCTVLMAVIMLVIGCACALGFGAWDFVTILGMGILDFLDFLTNSVMMPIAAMTTCILIIKVAGCDAIAKEVKISSNFRQQKIYNFCITYLAPICLAVILISSIANVCGWISM